MAKYRKKNYEAEEIEATQWVKEGDHKSVIRCCYVPIECTCCACDHNVNYHGRIKNIDGVHAVCPGDWIITGIKGEHYPCKPNIFEATYEKVED